MAHGEGKRLHCDIGKLLVDYIQRDKVVDMTRLAANMAQNLVELIGLQIRPTCSRNCSHLQLRK